jgi:hypothetical protein
MVDFLIKLVFLKKKINIKSRSSDSELVSEMRVTVLILPLDPRFLGHMDKKGYVGTLLVHG